METSKQHLANFFPPLATSTKKGKETTKTNGHPRRSLVAGVVGTGRRLGEVVLVACLREGELR
jgi:hypothetical protein